jgi:predicted metalloprotease with PDZ domain
MPTAGAKLGPYGIVSPLGGGEMGEVYRARDAKLERDVAIKVLPAAMSSTSILKWSHVTQQTRLSRFGRLRRFLGLAFGTSLIVVSAGPARGAPPPRPIELAVDATDAPRGRFHARLVIPAPPGPLTLAYPKWVQGEHAPTGPISLLAGLTITADGKDVTWRRDPLNLFLFHVEVPAGADSVNVELDYLSPVQSLGRDYGHSPNATPHLLIVDWHDLVLYPAGASADELPICARLRLPAGWKHDGALEDRAEPDGTLVFSPASLTTLLDSPVLAGDHFRSEVLEGGDRPARMSVAADRASSLEISVDQLAAYRNLVREARALFGARHYRSYHWLVALSDKLEDDGLEHHESTDIRNRVGFFTDAVVRVSEEGVIPHEYVHSWNGKFRRPLGMATLNPQVPMDTELLWVYEGLTRYLGNVILTGRSGQWNTEQSRDYVAWLAARQDRGRPGRVWRSLVDTAVSGQLTFFAPEEWASFIRAADYYDESMLVWLEADTIIRERSGGRQSLDDFCRDFFGGGDGPPGVRPYARGDVEGALGKVTPYDWHQFFTTHIYDVSLKAPLGGLTSAGWRLVYDARPNAFHIARATVNKALDHTFGIGLLLDTAGTAKDVVFDSAAWRAGFGPGMKVVAVDGRKFTAEVLEEEMTAARVTTAPIEFTIEHGEEIRTLHVDYHEGVLYSHLERDPSHPDLLTQILAPRAKP